MKRIVLLFIVTLLFLTACESTESAQEVSTPVFTIENELPDIGEFSGKKPQERFYKEYTPEFIPSDDYGEIIPFIGSRKSYTTSPTFGEKDVNHYSYGFCTPNGKIVMDASPYIYIEPRTTSNGFEYYYMSVENECDDYSSYRPAGEYFIPKSGKWCLPAETYYSTISDAGKGRILVSSIDMYFAVYDYDANKIFELDDISGFSYYRNDVAVITVGENDSSRCFYIDTEGNKILGDYRSATDFTEHGVAAIKDENGDCYLINTVGERVVENTYQSIDPVYDSFSRTSPALFSCSKDMSESTYDIYGADGKLINTITVSKTQGWIPFYFLGDNILYKNDGILYRLDDGKQFLGSLPCTVYDQFDLIAYSIDDMKAILDQNGNPIANLFDMYTLEDASKDHRYILYRSGEYFESDNGYKVTDNSSCYIYDTVEKKALFPLNGETYDDIYFTNDDKRYVMLNNYDYEKHENARNVTLYDTQSQRVLFKDVEFIRHSNISGRDYFLVCTLNSCTLYDSELNIIYKSYNE